MTTALLEKTVRKLSREISSLRDFVVEAVRNEDEEGRYKTAFVKKMLKASRAKAVLEYSGKGSLLRKLKTA